jgi:hypothetical protein
VEGSSERGNEPSDSIKAGKFLSGCTMAASQEGLSSLSVSE